MHANKRSAELLLMLRLIENVCGRNGPDGKLGLTRVSWCRQNYPTWDGAFTSTFKSHQEGGLVSSL